MSVVLSLFLCVPGWTCIKVRKCSNVTQTFSELHVFPLGGEWRIKYNRAVREMDFAKKKLQQEFDDKLETEQQSKRHVERKASANYNLK